MSRRKEPDWMDFAHQLDKKREAIQDKLPPGLTVSLSCHASEYGAADFNAHLNHRETSTYGHGSGRTPEKALEAARVDLEKNLREEQKRPALVVATSPKTLPAKNLFEGL
ncbi:MAG TPA: hypothetical protein VGE74_18010 [Gemmata sp.]